MQEHEGEERSERVQGSEEYEHENKRKYHDRRSGKKKRMKEPFIAPDVRGGREPLKKREWRHFYDIRERRKSRDLESDTNPQLCE